MEKINFKFLILFIILLSISFMACFYAVKNFNPEKNNKIEELKRNIDFLTGMVSISPKQYSWNDVSRAKNELRKVRKEKGLSGDSVFLIITISSAIIISCFIVLIPEIFKKKYHLNHLRCL